jgi:CRISPR-associated protein Cas1
MEATGAAKYFPLVFGETFVRDRGLPGTNARLNYGYAVIRSAVARAVVGAGLMPALGIHHHNQYNHLALVDDAIEPFRAIVDFGVRKHFGLSLSEEDSPLTPSEKRLLVQLIGCCVMVDGKSTPFLVGLGSYAASLRRAICEGGALNVPTIDFKSL